MISKFFIDRPVLANVMAILFVLAAEDDLPDLARKDWEQRKPSAVVLRR